MMRKPGILSAAFVVAILLLSGSASALLPPNPDSDFRVLNTDDTTIKQGCGVVLTGVMTGMAFNGTAAGVRWTMA